MFLIPHLNSSMRAGSEVISTRQVQSTLLKWSTLISNGVGWEEPLSMSVWWSGSLSKKDWNNCVGPFCRKDSDLMSVVPHQTAARKELLLACQTHVIKQGMHLRSWQCCHFDVEIVNKVGNCFKNISLDFNQSFVNCHLQVTVENFDELFEIKANVVIREIQQCSSPPFIWVICSQSLLKMTNHCNQSGGGVPVNHLKNPSHCPVYLQPVLCNPCNNLIRCKSSWLQLEVFLPGVPFARRVQGSRMDLDISYRILQACCGSPLFDNWAESKVTASKHSVGGAILDTCLCIREDAFVAAKAWARAV